MKVSEPTYAKAKLMLEFIQANPESPISVIHGTAGMIKETAQNVLAKMVAAGVLTVKTNRRGSGKRYLYTATGKPMPPRTGKISREPVLLPTTNLEPVDIDVYRRLPGIVRALTPVILPEVARSTVINGHTQEQHKLQSEAIRKDRAVSQQGVKYSGQSRYE